MGSIAGSLLLDLLYDTQKSLYLSQSYPLACNISYFNENTFKVNRLETSHCTLYCSLFYYYNLFSISDDDRDRRPPS